MLTDRAIDLSLLFGFTSAFDPRMAGRELQVEITMREIPPTINGIVGGLLCYTQVPHGNVDPQSSASEDTRTKFHFSNLRVEIEQQSFPCDVFPPRESFMHTFMDWQLAASPID